MPQVRLDKYLSDMGIASRKELRSIIKSGRVSVDGRAVCAPETKISSESRVCLDGEELRYSRFHYYMMNKPAGVLSATEDGKQRTVLDLVSEQMRRQGLFPVGRLDKDTCGLLLLTDDGDFAQNPKSKNCIMQEWRVNPAGKTPKPLKRALSLPTEPNVCPRSFSFWAGLSAS